MITDQISKTVFSIDANLKRTRSVPFVRNISRPRRIIFYSHDTQGLGHMRRNLLLAQTLLRLEPRPNILLIGGAREMGSLTIPQGIDCVTLPALHKSEQGHYQPRSLSISLRRISALRAGAIQAAVKSFDPDLLIVDKVPLGAFQELEPTLQWLKSQGTARCVLGLRDILDEPEVVEREWHAAGNDEAIRAYYDEVWVYGDPAVYDPAQEYGFGPDVTEKIVYTGYIDRRMSDSANKSQIDALWARLHIPDNTRVALCCVGGGQDGFSLAHAFANAPMPADMVGIIVTGPFMPVAEQQQLHRIAKERKNLRVLNFLEEPTPLIQRADMVITMAGYNTTCEVLSFAKRALLVPRVQPRQEQLIRAERLRDLQLVDMVHPEHLSPTAIGDWLTKTDIAVVNPHHRINLKGLDILPHLVNRLSYLAYDYMEVRNAA